MCEVTNRFPFRKAPVIAGKFPFRDMKYYTNYNEDEIVKEKPTMKTLGHLAQKSLDFLESTGRKPNLKIVPWFGAAVKHRLR